MRHANRVVTNPQDFWRITLATQLLGKHSGGYWLRRFCVPAADDHPGLGYVLALQRTPVSVSWWHVCALLQDREPFKQSAAMLEIAASIAGPHRVNLRSALQLLDDQERRLVLDAVAEAAVSPTASPVSAERWP
ncbi:hypothetical protein ACWGCW_38515 [Streptomyces sp. NPDC054933]